MKPTMPWIGGLVLVVGLVAVACRRVPGPCTDRSAAPCAAPHEVVTPRRMRVETSGAARAVSDSDLSLFRGSVFGTPTPDAVAREAGMPGNHDRVPHLFAGAPPVIPHGTDDFLPITTEDNACLECHLSKDEDPDEVPQLPASHLTDLREAPDSVGDAVAGARYVCVLCHVPLTDAEPLPELAPVE